jgi:HK97 family phage major capsid protein
MEQLSAADQEIIAHLRVQFRDQIDTALDTRLTPIQRELNESKAFVSALAARSSRAPGTTGHETSAMESPYALSRQLGADASFLGWLKSNKTQSSGFATELRLPSQRKAAISGISPTQHITPIYGTPAFPLRLASLLPTIPVTVGNIEYLQETSFVPGAAVVPETTVKPTTTATYAEKLAKIATIASVLKVSLQSLADIPQLSFWLDQRLLFAVLLKQEDTLLNGDATNGISGLMQLATPYAVAPLPTDNPMDTVARAAGALMAQGYSVDGVVMSATDYTDSRLLKNSQGSYLFMGTAATGPDDESVWEGTPLTWQIPTVISPSMPAGSFLVGAFKQSTLMFQRESANIQIAFQNEDDFVRNLACLRGELRSGLAVPLPAGLLKGTLGTGSTEQASHGVFAGKPLK